MSKLRDERLSSEFRKVIYEIINTRVKDPDITEIFSITRADVNSDLKNAKIYVSIFSADSEKKKKNFKAIENHAGFIRRELAHTMRTRTVPEIKFLLDDSMEYSDKINKLLNKIDDKN